MSTVLIGQSADAVSTNPYDQGYVGFTNVTDVMPLPSVPRSHRVSTRGS